ncbi:MAG: DeoR family transcriptional regulator [Anaerolineae bacterium]|nr:DeoR family transcriptional regulator [Anaerolineae bacterium]
MNTPPARRRRILAWLQTETTLSIEVLVSRLGVSAMTIHRDLDQLAREGLVQKSYGRATLVEPRPEAPAGAEVCRVCGTPVTQRTGFWLQMATGPAWHACCPHCGLMLFNAFQPQVAAAFTRDFLYARLVNAMKALYVVNSRVHLCCLPGLLCFASPDDAASFATGFGGDVLTFEEARAYLRDHQEALGGPAAAAPPDTELAQPGP